MLINDTPQRLGELRLAGMAVGLEEQLTNSACAGLGFEEWLALLVDRELHHRHDKRLAALLKRARLKYPQACIGDVHTGTGRGLNHNTFAQLALSRWVDLGLTISIIGRPDRARAGWRVRCRSRGLPTRALGAVPARTAAGRRVAHPARQGRLRRLAGHAGAHRGAGARRWALAPLEPATGADLLEIIDDRAGTPGRATIVATQLPVDYWHAWLGDPTMADAILDRLLANEHRISLKGDSLRRLATGKNAEK